jgi:preprotein translocase subunit SecG
MSGFFTFVLIIQTLVAVGLITLILMQRSEGGGLAGGGSPAGMMSARGASDFLTRGTSILATIFVSLSILLAGLAAGQRTTGEIQATKAPAQAPRPATPAPAPAPAQKAATPTPAPAAPAGNTASIPGQ